MNPEEPASLQREPGRAKPLAALAVCIVLFAGGNFSIMPLVQSPGPAGGTLLVVWAATLGAQAVLHSIWCVLAPWGLAKRLAVGTAIGLALFVAWALGYAVARFGQPYAAPAAASTFWQVVLSTLLALPLISIALQSPLWFARYFFRWRIVHRRDPARRAPLESIGIRDVLIATGAVAAALSSARAAIIVTGSPSVETMVAIVVGAMELAIFSLVTSLPLVVTTLRTAWLGASLVTFIGPHLLLIVMLALVFGRHGQMGLALLVALAFAVGFLGTQIGVMVIVRKSGYRLYRGRRHVAVRAKGPGVAAPGLGGM